LFPLRDENPTLTTPVVTIAFILVNVIVWLYVEGGGMSERLLADAVCQFGLIPAEVTNSTGGYSGVELGGSLPACSFGGLTRSAILTSMFMHGGWVHLIGNMWFLWLFGNNIEDSMGSGRFLVFYLLVGTVAAVSHVVAGPGSAMPMVGASGAVSGIMGAYLLLYPRVRIQTLFIFVILLRIIAVPAWLVLALWFALQVLAAYMAPVDTGGVAVWAHIGGFVAGALMIRIFSDRKRVAARMERAPVHQ
jgi:membrane associated rhomboid family serine protease